MQPPQNPAHDMWYKNNVATPCSVGGIGMLKVLYVIFSGKNLDI